jgi:indolepyruvate ferredoxin oxidoreductase
MTRNVALDDKYTAESGRVYLTGTQALVKLPMLQRQRDAAAQLNTAAFISGYRGSPLGGFDMALWKAESFLQAHNIVFQPGVNEDLGATAVWGSQQVNLFGGAKYDGVFGLWYGKGPGVDRCGDVFKHANYAGTSKYGGVLAIAGDDHTCKSSTLPHQSEYAFIDAQMPVLNPSGVQEILDLGIVGWELSRYCGCWIGFKTIAETIDSSISANVDPHRITIRQPTDFQLPPDGVHIRWPDQPMQQELRLQKFKLYAAIAFARANHLNYTVMDNDRPRIGIVTTGKAYLDVLQALDDLHIDANTAADIGLKLYKVGMSWPLEPEGVREFAEGLEEIIVVEEKRSVVESQLKEQLYNWREDVRPRVIGKFDEQFDWILPSTGELTAAQVARVIANRIGRFYTSPAIQERVEFLDKKEKSLDQIKSPMARTPHFCSGCPHNTSTKVPENSRALAGIGCHYMAIWMNRSTETFSQMGGEGAAWIGQAPFTETEHVFANIGDGTYFHSGLLAIRAAVASGANITYKLLYNDAVAMTGGQSVDGQLSVEQITHQLYGEGIRRICLVSDEPGKYRDHTVFASGVSIHHRDEMDYLQLQLRECKGTSVLIFDQTCAAEKRRRRKRGLMIDPLKRIFINQAVCEGCGDCGEQSRCLSIVPVETEFGRKRAIDQWSCNKDYTCAKGFCPSFVSVHGGSVRKSPTTTVAAPFPALPEPELPPLEHPYNIIVTGVGGTGVVTIGALIGMAAHIDEKGVSVLDMTGLAQKFGAVVSHLRIARQQEEIHAVRIPAGEAHLVLGCDLVVASSLDTLAKTDPRITRAVVNNHQSMPASFTQDPDLEFPRNTLESMITDATQKQGSVFIEATQLATRLLGDSVFANLLLLGYAYQSGLLPVNATSILRAIELNGVAVEKNNSAFNWGRLACHDPVEFDRRSSGPEPHITPTDFNDVKQLIDHRSRHLELYQNASYADRYRKKVLKFQAIDERLAIRAQPLTRAVAVYYAKVLAYKDEYEVARLYKQAEFWQQLEDQFEGDYQVRFHLAPPVLARRDRQSGLPLKREFGPWIRPLFSILHKMRFLRGTRLDVFAYSKDRKIERAIIGEYVKLLDEVLEHVNYDNYDIAVELLRTPEFIRGYGHVKKRHYELAKLRQAKLLRELKSRKSKEQVA